MFHSSLTEYLRFHVYKEINFQLWGLSELIDFISSFMKSVSAKFTTYAIWKSPTSSSFSFSASVSLVSHLLILWNVACCMEFCNTYYFSYGQINLAFKFLQFPASINSPCLLMLWTFVSEIYFWLLVPNATPPLKRFCLFSLFIGSEKNDLKLILLLDNSPILMLKFYIVLNSIILLQFRNLFLKPIWTYYFQTNFAKMHIQCVSGFLALCVQMFQYHNY